MNLRYSILIVFAILFVAAGVFAEETAPEEDVYAAMMRLIGEGKEVAYIVSTAVEVGESACEVVKIAFEALGDVTRIIEGALKAGISSDTISSCLLEVGAEPSEVAEALKRATLIVITEVTPPAIITGLPAGGGSAGEAVSPSGF